MAESKTLSLKKPLSLTQEAKLHQLMGLVREIEEKNPQEKKCQEDDRTNSQISNKRRLREAMQWFAETYPECFNFQDPKPLRIGIINDIYLQGKWPHSKNFLRKTLACYTGSLAYQRALLREPHRVSLTGKVVDTVTDQQKSVAEERLKHLKEKKETTKVNKSKQEKEALNIYTKESHKKAANENT